MPWLRLTAPEAERLAVLDFVRSVRDRLQLCSKDVEHQVGIRCDWQLRKVGIEREALRPAGGEPFVTQDWTHSPSQGADPKRAADSVVSVDRAWLFHLQQLDRFGLTLSNRLRTLVPTLAEEQSMNFPQKCSPLIPCDPRVQIRIGRRPSDVGLEDRRACVGEVP